MPLLDLSPKKTGVPDMRDYRCGECSHEWQLDHDGYRKDQWMIGCCPVCTGVSLPKEPRGYQAIMGKL